jgi:hypothetical protein
VRAAERARAAAAVERERAAAQLVNELAALVVLLLRLSAFVLSIALRCVTYVLERVVRVLEVLDYKLAEEHFERTAFRSAERALSALDAADDAQHVPRVGTHGIARQSASERIKCSSQHKTTRAQQRKSCARASSSSVTRLSRARCHLALARSAAVLYKHVVTNMTTATTTSEQLVISGSGKVAHVTRKWLVGNARVGGRVLAKCGVRMHAFRVTRDKCEQYGWTVCETCVH